MSDAPLLRSLETGNEPGEKGASEARTLAMLGLLAGLGAHPAVTEMLAELAGLRQEADTHHWLVGPIVVHSSAWTDTLPAWMFWQARAERWEVVAGTLPGHIVGPTELACVMYGAMMDAPRHGEIADLYLWAVGHACRRKHGAKVEAAVAEITERLRDEDFLARGGRRHHGYASLCHEIRRKVAAEHRSSVRADKKAGAPPKAPPKTAPVVKAEQFDIFG